MYRKPQFKAQTLPTPTDVSQQDRTDTDEEMAAEHVSLLPQQGDQEHIISTDLAIGGLGYISETSRKRCMGLEPENCYGEIVLDKVEMYYPARPQRKVLDQISLRVPPGKIAALVGQSGGGKSRYVGTLRQLKSIYNASIQSLFLTPPTLKLCSVISLVQHLYEPSSGKVCIDGHEVRLLT